MEEQSSVHPRVLIILGHPRSDSLSHAMGEAYERGAREAGIPVRKVAVSEMRFEPDVVEVSPRQQTFEDDIQRVRRLIEWADHLVFVYPTWWGTIPARLKGLLDRVFTAGFAFDEIEGGTGYAQLLTGKSAHLITTMDTPRFVYRWLYGKPGHNAMRRATLQFCGVKPVRVSAYGPVKDSTRNERDRWLAEVQLAGKQLQDGVETRWERLRRKGGAWLRALRLQFYPMTWMAYTAGSLGAARIGGLDTAAFWIGYVYLFFLEVATVLTNDLFDLESDRENEFFSPFTGGSRVLVEGALKADEVRVGAVLAVAVAVGAAGSLAFIVPPSITGVVLAVLGAMLVLALGYTLPPLKLSHRGLGEVDVALTHSTGVILCGYAIQGGQVLDPLPWLLSVPLFLAVLPAIVLAGIPDYEADRQAGKETLVVKLGPHRAMYLAAALVGASALTAVVWPLAGWAEGALQGLAFGAVPHAVVLGAMLAREAGHQEIPRRMDAVLAAALAYILWFAALPLVNWWGA